MSQSPPVPLTPPLTWPLNIGKASQSIRRAAGVDYQPAICVSLPHSHSGRVSQAPQVCLAVPLHTESWGVLRHRLKAGFAPTEEWPCRWRHALLLGPGRALRAEPPAKLRKPGVEPSSGHLEARLQQQLHVQPRQRSFLTL